MKITILILILSIVSLVLSNKYTADQHCTKDENGQEHCIKKSDEDFEEEDDEEPCFFEQPKDRLFAWDPVKAC